MRKPLVVLLAAMLANSATGAAAAPCAMDPADRAWLEGALDNWRRVEREYLLLDPRPLPTVVAIDGECAYLLPEGRFDDLQGSPHDGTVKLPDGNEAPIGPISFASGEGGGYFAMSLPSVWRVAGVTSELGLERLMDGVLLHEIMHTRQNALATPVFGKVIASGGAADDEINDDMVQALFEKDADYVAAWSAERDLLFAAAAAPTDEEARQLAKQALEAMRQRRARWFTGERAFYGELDDVFLTMEGTGQWLIYRYFASGPGGAGSADAALAAVRRNKRWWSQEEGLGLILVVDRLLPGWQARAFREPDWRAERLLAAAVDGEPGAG